MEVGEQYALIPPQEAPRIALERAQLGLCAFSECEAKPTSEVYYTKQKLHYLFCVRHQLMWAKQDEAWAKS